MKKIIIAAIAIIAMTSFSANAKLYVGGSAAFDFTTGSGSSNTSWAIAPEVGYNFNEKIGVGMALSFGGNGGSGSSVFCVEADPYFRWYFAKVGKVKFLNDVVLSLGAVDSKFTWGINLRPGIAVDLTEKWGIVSHIANIGYTGIKDSGTFNLDILGRVDIGIYYNF